MNQHDVYVEVIDLEAPKGKDVIKRVGPMSEGKAELVEMGLLRNMDLEKFSTRQVPA